MLVYNFVTKTLEMINKASQNYINMAKDIKNLMSKIMAQLFIQHHRSKRIRKIHIYVVRDVRDVLINSI